MTLGAPVERGASMIASVPIGVATSPIAAGDWIHSHNLRTALSGLLEYAYEAEPQPLRRTSSVPLPAFQGFRRQDGRVGTRNELWVLNTVGCVNHAAERIPKQAGVRVPHQIES